MARKELKISQTLWLIKDKCAVTFLRDVKRRDFHSADDKIMSVCLCRIFKSDCNIQVR